ncbi:MAG: sialidase family protein [Planctomycetaceae bacterium]
MLGESETTSETALLRLKDGKWLAAARSNTSSFLYLYHSMDDGHTWSEPTSMKIPGFPANLYELSDGRILITAGQRGCLQWYHRVAL